jgi:hypothetical protein
MAVQRANGRAVFNQAHGEESSQIAGWIESILPIVQKTTQITGSAPKDARRGQAEMRGLRIVMNRICNIKRLPIDPGP